MNEATRTDVSFGTILSAPCMEQTPLARNVDMSLLATTSTLKYCNGKCRLLGC